MKRCDSPAVCEGSYDRVQSALQSEVRVYDESVSSSLADLRSSNFNFRMSGQVGRNSTYFTSADVGVGYRTIVQQRPALIIKNQTS